MNRLIMVLLAALTTLSLVGCGDSVQEFINTPPSVQPIGFLRFAHFSPDAPNVDIAVDGSPIATNVPFETVSDYVAFTVGQRRVQVFATGDATNPVIDAQVQVNQNTFQTVAALNTVASIQPGVFADTVTNDSGSALLRVLHASPDAGPVDLTLADGTVLAANLAFPNATEYLSVAPGVYNLQLRAAGTSTVVRDFRGVEVAAGQTLTAAAIGLLADQSLDVLVLVDDASAGSQTLDLVETLATFRAAHLSPGSPNVDVEVDGLIVASNVPYPTVSGYLTTPARSNATVRILQAGTNTQLLNQTFPLSLDPNDRATFAAVGSIADSNLQLLAIPGAQAGSGGSATNTTLRAFHAVPNATAVDVVVTTSGNQLIADALTFPNASAYTSFPQDTNATIDVDLDAGGDVVELTGQNLSAGNIFTAFVIGRAGDAVTPPAVLLVNDL